jgi:hypothetical protein
VDAAVSGLPELGPHLGRLAALPEPGDRWVPLDDVRLALATGVLEHAGAARAFGDDRAAVVGSLRRREWLELWDAALASAAARTVAAIDHGFASAAATARLPRRRRAALAVTADERAAIAARLGAGAAPFVAALEKMEHLAGPAARGGPAGDAAFAAWWEAVTEAGRRLEAAWESLEAAVRAEEPRWRQAMAETAAWRRPVWPLWLATAALLAAATALGLVLGGYVPAPSWLRPFADWWWATVRFG